MSRTVCPHCGHQHICHVDNRLQEQIEHIQEHQAEFNEHQVSTVDVDVAAYFRDADDGPDQCYLNLCSDLGITPKRHLT